MRRSLVLCKHIGTLFIKKEAQLSALVGLQLSQFGNQLHTSPEKSSGKGKKNDYFHRNKWYILGLGLASAAVVTHDRWKTRLDLSNLVLKLNAAGPGGDADRLDLRAKFNFIADVVEKVSPAVVFIDTSTLFKQGCGSGFIISSDGLIITNAHVVQSSRNGNVDIKLSDGRKCQGKIEVVDSVGDLALIKINETNLPTIKIGKSDHLRPGEYVIAVGSPLSLSNTVTSGIVSSTCRNSKELGLPSGINYIQTDAPITFGNSGGPLINLDGEAVGVNSMKVAEGISFAIPSDYVSEFLIRAEDYKKGKLKQKKSRPPYIGITTLTLTPHVAAQLRNRVDITNLGIDRGVFVVQVNSGSPAQQAGIQKYDIIMKVDEAMIDNYNDLIQAIKNKNMVKCMIYRGGAILEIHIRPQHQSD